MTDMMCELGHVIRLPEPSSQGIDRDRDWPGKKQPRTVRGSRGSYQ